MKSLLLSVLLLLFITPQAAQSKQPNILWLIGENLTAGDLACYGGTNVHTPNLDALAAACLCHQSHLRAQPLGLFHRHVSDHHGHASHAQSPHR